MDTEQRSYSSVSVEMIGIEHGLERFSKDGITTLPPVAKWRNNLTALSQRENLFFVASNDTIAVYEPEFPYQTLRRQPCLLIKPKLRNPHALGYLSSHRGGLRDEQDHCINHLLIGDLGSEEIVVLVTDSGNVEAYYTNSILEAIRRAPGQYCDHSNLAVHGLRPFFSYWESQSTWGIDIHKEDRMIAISKNVPNSWQPGNDADTSSKIIVFAFALTPRPSSDASPDMDDESSDHEDDDDDEWIPWRACLDSVVPKRDRNYKITLAGWPGHAHNVPNISFVVNSEGSIGTWLLSTDITGAMKLWRVWDMKCYRTWTFDGRENSVRLWGNQQYPGWSVAALDVSWFRSAKSDEEFAGAKKTPQYFGYHDQGRSYNLTPVVERLRGNSRLHPSSTEPEDHESASEGDQIFSNDSDDEAEHVDPDEMEGVEASVHHRPPIQALDSVAFEGTGARDRDHPRQIVFVEEVSERPESDEDHLESDEDDVLEDSDQLLQQLPNLRIQRHIARQVTPIQNPDIKPPSIAMIHCGDAHVRLLGSPKARFPHVFCANILRQEVTPDVRMHTEIQGIEFFRMERLNMLHKIPELGVVLIATQTGRLAVCALTKHSEGWLGFRVDWIVPTRKQERDGGRPEYCTLVGVAAAPVQGRQVLTQPAMDDEEESPPQDGEMDGIHTSFDPEVVKLRHPPTVYDKHEAKCQTKSAAARAKCQKCKAGAPQPIVERQSWKRPPIDTLSWQATNTSRSFRIMMTYSDMSVLTYEISRGIK